MGRAKADRDEAAPELRKILAGVVLGLVALLLWLSRDVVSSWFATSSKATIELTTFSERDDARVQRAFAFAQSARAGDATLELLPGLSQIRDSVVHVTGPSSAEAIAAAQSLSQAIVAAFNAEGPGRIDASVRRRTDPVPGPTSNAVLAVFVYGALVLVLAGLAFLWLAWRDWPADRPGMPRYGIFIGIAGAGWPLLIFIMPGWLFMALFAMFIPCAIAGMIVYKMRDVRRAARWPSAQGRIVRSCMRAVRRQKAGEATTVSNVPDIEYAFSVGGVEYRGHRIGIGEIAPGSAEAEAALERYKVGRTGPVFYNPDKPEEAVLERDAPFRPGVMYGIAAGIVLVGLSVVAAFTRLGEIIAWLQPYFPPGAFVPGVLFFAAAGLLMTLFLISNRRTALAAARWPTTTGTILSSKAEGHRTLATRGQGPSVTVWSPVVEYSYRVLERDYHGSRIAFGGDVAASRDFAEAIVDRYPTGSMVVVHFDPDSPSVSVLEPRIAFAWPTLLITLAFFAAALFFAGAFGHAD
jgi:hypothetical protein